MSRREPPIDPYAATHTDADEPTPDVALTDESCPIAAAYHRLVERYGQTAEGARTSDPVTREAARGILRTMTYIGVACEDHDPGSTAHGQTWWVAERRRWGAPVR